MSRDQGRNAIVYCRISQDRTGAGLGVERQRADCEKLAERLGWSIVGVHTDNDISAYSRKKRPGYLALLADLEAGRATGVLAWHTDRLHRSPLELESYIDVCERHSVITQTVTAGPLDLSTPAGRMHARIAGAVARHESEHRSARVRSKRQEVAETGAPHPGPRPFGFKKGGIKHRKAEAKLIKDSIDAILDDGASLRTVVRLANETGLRTTFGRLDWDAISFKEVLLRPRNAGLRQHRGEIIGRGSWKRIVSEERWRTLVAVLNDPKRKTTPGNRVRWLGSGLYVCGGCGEAAMRCSTSGQHRQPSYRCRGPGKEHVVRSAAALDDFVARVIVARLSRPDAADLFVPPQPTVDLNALRAERDVLTSQSEQLTAELDTPRPSRTVARIVAAAEKLDRRLDDIESAIADATVPGPLRPFADGADPQEVWDALDIDGKRAAMKTLLTVTVLPVTRGRPFGWSDGDGTYFDPRGVRIDWRTPGVPT